MAEVVQALGACLSAQRSYGRQAADLETTAKTFIAILGDYDADDVLKAFAHWVKTQTEFPTPADIYRLVSGEKPLDGRIYSRIVASMRMGDNITREEWAYLSKYEKENM